ncbi:CAF17-like 4Fe-4S cluster assembly/insertion protein YgfZ [Paracraurococcus ruber]|uniref:Folate-binding protein YgfZ n=1 Tax=Paracraurococcus ruber TaxID=77675 RepID=A0ABS1CUD8_9PROT|nr:folate-binding protein YgfZ [Paracraurococcus ruber]MBK1658109.1 folate-binding protein YgfZ [Paracraurococcus ruber]
MPIADLPDRGVVEVAGEDRVAFLQGLLSNDVALAAPGRAVFAALLTPQGKWWADMLVLAADDRLLLDCERAQAPALAQRLARFRLRSKVTVHDASGAFTVQAGSGATAEDWDRHRLALGLPDGSKDLVPEQTVLLEAGFDELHGISWTKGCYMGQELTARTKYRGLLKRRLVPVAVDGPLPGPGTPVLAGEAEAGEMRSGRDGMGIAQLRLEALDGRPLRCGDAALLPRIPSWMMLPAREPA